MQLKNIWEVWIKFYFGVWEGFKCRQVRQLYETVCIRVTENSSLLFKSIIWLDASMIRTWTQLQNSVSTWFSILWKVNINGGDIYLQHSSMRFVYP